MTTPPRTYEEGWADAMRHAAVICEEQQKTFLSIHYSHDQPYATMSERFACQCCIHAILLAVEPPKGKF